VTRGSRLSLGLAVLAGCGGRAVAENLDAGRVSAEASAHAVVDASAARRRSRDAGVDGSKRQDAGVDAPTPADAGLDSATPRDSGVGTARPQDGGNDTGRPHDSGVDGPLVRDAGVDSPKRHDATAGWHAPHDAARDAPRDAGDEATVASFCPAVGTSVCPNDPPQTAAQAEACNEVLAACHVEYEGVVVCDPTITQQDCDDGYSVDPPIPALCLNLTLTAYYCYVRDF